MTERELFDKACHATGIGSRLDIENFPEVPSFSLYEHTRTIALELIASAHHHIPSLPPIHFDFLDEPKVNAVALRYHGEYFIGVTAGALMMLHLVLDRMLANPNTLTFIGDPSKESADKLAAPWDVIDAEHWYSQGVRQVLAKDQDRLLYSKHIADQAIMFLLGHEIAHITRGHVDFLDASSGNPFLAELGWQGAGDQKLQRQVIEADADRRSIFARCKSLYTTATNNVNQGRIVAWTGKPATIEELQFDGAFAVNVLFRLFGDERFSGTDLKSISYPPLPLRRRLAVDYACNILMVKWGAQHKDKIHNALRGSVDSAEKSFLAIGASLAAGGFAEAFSTEAENHLARLNDCWKTVETKLASLAYESLDITSLS